MEISVDVRENTDHLLCVGSFPFTHDNAVACIQLVLRESLRTGKRRVLLDLTPIREAAAATLKCMIAIRAEEEIISFTEQTAKSPRVAVLGSAPLISTYKPADELFRISETQVAVFTDRDAAKRWLLADH